MLIPKFTIRWLLLLMSVCSVFFLVFNFAVRGQQWAIAISLAVAGMVVTFLAYGVFFGLAYILASLFGAVRPRPPGGSPFAAGPPPQILPPVEPEQV